MVSAGRIYTPPLLRDKDHIGVGILLRWSSLIRASYGGWVLTLTLTPTLTLVIRASYWGWVLTLTLTLVIISYPPLPLPCPG